MKTRTFFIALSCLFGMTIAMTAQERNCGVMQNLAFRQKANPGLAAKMAAIEEATAQKIALGSKAINGDIITIPVVVHILYNTNQQNISDAQILSQIAVLNEDFRLLNGDRTSAWSDREADVQIEFCMATEDPNGNATNGITRKQTTRSSWGTNDAIKFNSNGGQNAWDSSQYLNMWVGEIGGGILGYAQFPGGSASTDGVVMSPQYFGSAAKGNGFFLANRFDLGRTTTHEVGHFLNLRHIWGDGNCNRDDLVNDTPLAGGSNNGCPSTNTNSCNSGGNDERDMYENYMDYTDDRCMNLFTQGQKDRMRAILLGNGVRSRLAQSTKCSGGGNPTPTPTPSDCANSISSFPYSESFEGSVGDWAQASGDDLNFTVNSGGTPSNSTGPNGAIDGNSYIYVEASGDGTGFPNKTAILNSPCLDFGNVSNPNLSFDYHMLGSAINSLTVEARVDNEGNWTAVFRETGAQGSDWNAADVDLSAYAGEESTQLRFIVVTGSGNEGWQSDIAIDNLTIENANGNPNPGPDPDPDGCDSLDFDDFTVSPFSDQDSVGTFSVVNGGAGLSLENNTWKFIALNYTVTANTVIEFDFSSTSQGEIHGIGFESDNELSDNLYFKVHGTQNYGVTNFDDYAGGTKNYVIPVGSFYTGNADRLVFINDNDAGSGNNSIFTNVKIYEGSCGNASAITVSGERVTPVLGDTVEGAPSDTAISVLPNYTSDRFAININGDSSNPMYATIYSILGRKIVEVKLENGANQFSAQNLSMESGMYLISISGGLENAIIKRLMVK